MPHYRRVGEVPAKRHVRVVDGDGERRFEELMGEHGFSGASSLLYHRRSPSALRRIDCAEGPGADVPTFRANHPVRPHHLRTPDLDPSGDQADALTGRRHLLGNADVRIAWLDATAPGPLLRNAMGDELVYVQDGRGRLESVFGPLEVAPGDYVVVPRGTTHRWVPAPTMQALVVESTGHIGLPPQHLTATGQLREGAPFSERDLRAPTDLDGALSDGATSEDGVEVVVRTRTGAAVHVHEHHPFDVAGWDGCVYPWAFQIHDFEPIVGRLHQPPPVHQTFTGPGFVVCSFVPRPYDFDPEAVKVPYHHANVDSDEVLFYSDGDFMSRAGSGIGVGSISLHPGGFVHGPQPASLAASETATATGETAVMIDTFAPLGLSDAALAISDPDYVRSWGASS
jgi:homogentisate 1,2-dioxygenase